MKITRIYLLLAALVLSGCAANQRIEYAPIDKSVKLHVSQDIISTWSETEAKAAHIADSQVFVTKNSSDVGIVTAGALFGVIGSSIAISATRDEARKRASTVTEYMTQRFDDLVTEILQSQLQQQNITAEIVGENDYLFKLLPSVQFAIDKERRSLLEFRLTTRYKTSDEKPKTKNYHYTVDNANFPLVGDTGWFGEGDRFEQIKARGFEYLIKAFVADINGDIPAADLATMAVKERIYPSTGQKVKYVTVKETDEFQILAPVVGKTVFENALLVVGNEPAFEQPAVQAVATIQSSDQTPNYNAAVVKTTATTTQYPDLVNDLRSSDPLKMRAAAIRVGQEKLYDDPGIIDATVEALNGALASGVSKRNKYRVDGLAWCLLNLSNTGDKQHLPLLEKVKTSDLPKKVRGHANHAIKTISRSR